MATADRTQKGLVLKQAREAKGISLEAVQDATKIPLDSLKAIEEGYRVRTLTDFYYRAFVKLYAKYLGVDVNTVLEDYHAEKIPEPTKFHKGRTIWEDEKIPFFTKANIKRLFKIAIVLLVLFGCVRLVGCWVRSWPEKSEKVEVKILKQDKKRSETAKPKATKNPLSIFAKQPAPAKVAVAEPVAEKRKKQKINLTVRPKKTTWISVRVDGVDLSRSTLAKGASESWQALESIEISGKNLGDLEFELNGQAQSSFGRTHRRIKKIIVNQDGFKVQD